MDGTESNYTRRQLLCTLGLGAGFTTENQITHSLDTQSLLLSGLGVTAHNDRNVKTTQAVRLTLDRTEFKQRYREILNDDPETAQKIMDRDAFDRYYDGRGTEFIKMNVLYRPDTENPANSKLQVGTVDSDEIEDINNVPSAEISYSSWLNVSDTVVQRLVPEDRLTSNSATNTATTAGQGNSLGEGTSSNSASDTVPLVQLVAIVVSIAMSAIAVTFAFWTAFRDYTTSDPSGKSDR